MQGTQAGWVAPVGPLGELTAAAAARATALQAHAGHLEEEAARANAVGSFAAALRRNDVAIIAEIKRRSPSKGVIHENLDARVRAGEYERGGAAALSVLTEPLRFGGSLDDLRAVRRASSIPLLRKDFIVDRLQLLEARAAGASAALLIARALAPRAFLRLADDALALGLDLLLEVRDEAELDRALRVEAAVIGVNNRNLETLELDDSVSERLLRQIPRGRIAVYESGVSGRKDVDRAAALGADAVLVGSSLSSSADGALALAALVGVPRCVRAG